MQSFKYPEASAVYVSDNTASMVPQEAAGSKVPLRDLKVVQAELETAEKEKESMDDASESFDKDRAIVLDNTIKALNDERAAAKAQAKALNAITMDSEQAAP